MPRYTGIINPKYCAEGIWFGGWYSQCVRKPYPGLKHCVLHHPGVAAAKNAKYEAERADEKERIAPRCVICGSRECVAGDADRQTAATLKILGE